MGGWVRVPVPSLRRSTYDSVTVKIEGGNFITLSVFLLMSLTLLKYGVGGLLTLAGGVTVYKIVEWKQDNVKSYIRVEALRMKLGISDQSDVTSFNLRENLLHKLCIGTWAWGAYAGNKISAWKGTPNNSKEDNEDAFNAAMDAVRGVHSLLLCMIVFAYIYVLAYF